MKVLVVGAGFSGATIARQCADAGIKVVVIDKRDHVGGNCHTYRDTDTQILIHAHGPHIFHTNDREVWDFVRRFGKFKRYNHSVFTKFKDQVFSLPVNLQTLNQFWKSSFSPAEAQRKLRHNCRECDATLSFEHAAISAVGPELYNAFFKTYTEKQWGVSATEIPASVFKRLPVRFSYTNNYFNHDIQAMPVEGYTDLIQNMLRHPNIEIELNCRFSESLLSCFSNCFYSGPIDEFFNHNLGKLTYRSLSFEHFRSSGDFQGCAVMNFADSNVKFTRITEHKHFAPWETHDQTIYTKEYPSAHNFSNDPYYPVRLQQDKSLLKKYEEQAEQLSGICFVGRLGTYRYLDMDQTIREALDISDYFINQTTTSRLAS